MYLRDSVDAIGWNVPTRQAEPSAFRAMARSPAVLAVAAVEIKSEIAGAQELFLVLSESPKTSRRRSREARRDSASVVPGADSLSAVSTAMIVMVWVTPYSFSTCAVVLPTTTARSSPLTYTS